LVSKHSFHLPLFSASYSSYFILVSRFLCPLSLLSFLPFMLLVTISTLILVSLNRSDRQHFLSHRYIHFAEIAK
jgi:hypothetical protein